MSDRRLDDELFRAVSAARPAPRGDGDSPFSPDAQAVVERVLTTKRAPTRRARRAIVRWSGHAIPALASVGALALAALALLVLVPRHPQVANPTAGPYHRLTATQYEFALDFADYDLPNAALLFRAEQVLRARCMQARGFRYVMDPAGSRSGSNTSPSLPFAEGSPSTFYPSPILGGYPRATLLAYVSAYGFGIYDDAIARPVRAASEQYQMTLRPALLRRWLKAFEGPTGCYDVAQDQLYGSVNAANLALGLANGVGNYLVSVFFTRETDPRPRTPRLIAVTAEWSRCMQSATGRTWPDENTMIMSLPYRPTQTRTLWFRRLEIRYAVDDVKCAYSTGLARAYAEAVAQAMNHLPPNLERQLQFLLSHRPAWVARARRILASSRSAK